MGERRRIGLLIIIMTIVAAVGVGVSIMLLYRAAFEEEKERLVETAQSQARLLEAVARFDAVHSLNYPGGSVEATLSQMNEAHEQYERSGQTGEIVLAQRDGDQIVFLLSHRHASTETPEPISFDSQLAEPMRLSLSGQSGTVVGLDYRGERVLAAYEPVDVLDMGIVAKIDLSELREPFIQAAVLAGLAALVLVTLGTVAFVRVSNPLLRSLEQSESLFRSTFEQSAVGFVHLSLDGRITRFNRRFCEIAGCSPADLQGFTLSEMIFPEDRERVTPLVAEMRAGGREYVDHESRLVRPDGVMVWVAATLSLVHDIANKEPYICVVIRDIGARKAAEDALRLSEERLRLALTAARQGTWQWIPPADQIILDEGSLRMLGFEADVDQSPGFWEQRIHPDDAEGASLALFSHRDCLTDQFSAEFRMQAAAGDWKWIHSSGKVVQRDAQGQALLAVGIHQDVTAQKLAAAELDRYRNHLEELIAERTAELTESEERFRGVFEESPIGIALLDAIGDLVAVNRAQLDIFGLLDSTDLAGINLFDDPHTPADLRASMAGGTTRRFETEYEIDWPAASENVGESRRDRLYLDVMATPLMSAELEQPDGYLVQIVDITNRKLAEAALQEAQEQLIRRERLAVLGQLAGGIGHELRHPLGVISNAVYYLRHAIESPDDVLEEYLGLIEQETQGATKIVSDLMDYARTRMPDRDTIGVNELVSLALERYPAPPAVRVTIQIEPDLPVLWIDVQHMLMVLGNLLVNAYQAMSDEGGLAIRAAATDGRVDISLQDSGPGIDPEYVEHLFEPLFTTKTRGIGLGLATARNLVRANGGEIEVQSRPGQGAEFHILLPCRGPGDGATS